MVMKRLRLKIGSVDNGERFFFTKSKNSSISSGMQRWVY